MPRTTHRVNKKALSVGVVIATVIAGCGSTSDTSSTTSPGGNRHLGEYWGQEETSAAISRSDCQELRRSVEREVGGAAEIESEPSPPSSRCLVTGPGVRISVYLDAAYAARQRYYNRIVEQVQFYGTDPARTPQAVAGVGDRSAHEHTASWIPAFSTLYAVRGNRWITVAYSDPALPRPQRRENAAALARQAFKLTARQPAEPRPSASPARR
jgi:hypothetical protein